MQIDVPRMIQPTDGTYWTFFSIYYEAELDIFWYPFFTNTYTVNKVLGKGELTIPEIFLLLVTIESNSVSVKRGTLN